jgi:hypothetical protein
MPFVCSWVPAGTGTFRRPPMSIMLGGGLVMSSVVGRSGMSLPDDNKKGDNVVRLGTETLFAIAEELRRMYDADLRSKPSEQLERLMRRIERGEKLK